MGFLNNIYEWFKSTEEKSKKEVERPNVDFLAISINVGTLVDREKIKAVGRKYGAELSEEEANKVLQMLAEKFQNPDKILEEIIREEIQRYALMVYA